MCVLRAACILALLLCLPAEAADGLSALVGKAGHVIVLRHARAPGLGDPPDFRLGDCSTQRNLSTEGRRQAARIGNRLRAALRRVAEGRFRRQKFPFVFFQSLPDCHGNFTTDCADLRRFFLSLLRSNGRFDTLTASGYFFCENR